MLYLITVIGQLSGHMLSGHMLSDHVLTLPPPGPLQSEVEIAKFYTPNVSSGLPGSDHAPQIVHSQNGSAGDHSTLVQRTFKFLNQKSTADHDKMSEDEKYSPFITKDGKFGSEE